MKHVIFIDKQFYKKRIETYMLPILFVLSKRKSYNSNFMWMAILRLSMFWIVNILPWPLKLVGGIHENAFELRVVRERNSDRFCTCTNKLYLWASMGIMKCFLGYLISTFYVGVYKKCVYIQCCFPYNDYNSRETDKALQKKMQCQDSVNFRWTWTRLKFYLLIRVINHVINQRFPTVVNVKLFK